MPMPAPRPTPVPAPPEGFAAAAFIESARANCWYAAAFVRPSTLAEAIFSRASLIDSGRGMFKPLIWMISMPRLRKWGFAFARTPCSMSFRLAAKSTTRRPFAFIFPNVTLSCFTSSFLIRSSISAEVAALDHVEVRVLEEECILGAPLAVEDPLLEVVDLRLLDDAGEGLDEPAENRRVLGRKRVAVRTVEVCEDLAVAVEHRDLVLANDDVVVHPDIPRDLPHDVLSLELVVPRNRHAAGETFGTARCLVRSPSAAEEERDGNHCRHRTWMPVTAFVRDFHAVSKEAIASRSVLSVVSMPFASPASRIPWTVAAARSSDSSIA